MKLRVSLFALCLSALSALAQPAVPTKVNFTARLVDNGAPVTGTRNFVFSLYPTLVGGNPVWTETRNNLSVTDGAVNVDLGAATPLTDTILDGQTLYLEVTVGTQVLAPRTALLSAPYAVRSTVTSKLGQLEEADVQRRVSGTCTTGSSIRTINPDGTVVCQASATVADAGVSITSVNAGTGLTGGGATGDVSLAVNFAGSGTAATASRSDHGHTGTYLPLGPSRVCMGTDKVVSIDSSGSVLCSTDLNTSYDAVFGGGLQRNASNQFSLQTCNNGQVLQSTVNGWLCLTPPWLPAGGVSAPLQLSMSTPATLSLGIVPIANGGTGANSAPTARSSLGAAASGANTDITSLGGLSTPLSAGQGGTGLTPPSTANLFLKSTATGSWTASGITATDVPSGSGHYVQNQTAAAQPANLYVTGVVRTTGVVRVGAENSGEVPRVDSAGYTGMVMRPLNSSTATAGSIIARTDQLVFERDGVANNGGGFRVRKAGSAAQRGYVMCQGHDTLGTQRNKVVNIGAGATTGSTFAVYGDAELMVFISCNFGTLDTATLNHWHHTSFTMSRTDTGTYWAGFLQSTYNQ